MPHVAFRHALALVQLALFLALSLQCHWEEKPTIAQPGSGEVGWDIRTDQSVPDVCQICYAINIPVVVAFWMLAALPDRFFWLGEIPLAFGVLILWYGVGVWRDRRVGILPHKVHGHAGKKRWILAWLGLVVLCSIVILSLFALMDRWWNAEAIGFGVIGWSAFGVLLITSKMHAWRRAKQSKQDLSAT